MNSSERSASRTDLPEDNELEVSLFGPGVGESVVVHLGSGDWLVVDSCLNRPQRQPVALSYLQALGVNPAAAIKLVVATHWHDDHMRGIAEVLRVAEAAVFSCSAALHRAELYTLVSSRERALATESGIDEFDRILEILKARTPAAARAVGIVPTWATANQRLFQRAVVGGNPPAEVFALSPSPASVALGFLEIAAQRPPLGTQKKRLISQSPNQASVVLHVAVGDVCVVLGADLENSRDPTLGWQAIIDSGARPQKRALVLKVAHHGSPNADHPDVWPRMLTEQPFSLIAPYSRGVRPLPHQDDLGRLRSRSDNVYCTAPHGGRGLPRRDPAVEKTLKEMTKARRVLEGRMGHVRVRLKVGAGHSARVELFNGAYKAG